MCRWKKEVENEELVVQKLFRFLFSFFLETNEEIQWENYVENNEKVKNNKEFSLFDKH